MLQYTRILLCRQSLSPFPVLLLTLWKGWTDSKTGTYRKDQAISSAIVSRVDLYLSNKPTALFLMLVPLMPVWFLFFTFYFLGKEVGISDVLILILLHLYHTIIFKPFKVYVKRNLIKWCEYFVSKNYIHHHWCCYNSRFKDPTCMKVHVKHDSLNS